MAFAKADGPLSIPELQKKFTGSSKYLTKQLQLLQERSAAYPALHWQKERDGWVFTCGADFKYNDLVFDYVTESINYRLLIQLFEEGSLNFYQVLQDYAISEPTYYRRIRELNQLLQEFQLKITNGHLRGPELQIRYFYYHLLLMSSPFDPHPEKKVPLLSKLWADLQDPQQPFVLQSFEGHALALLLTVFFRRWRLPQGDLQPLSQITAEPLQQRLAAIIKEAQPQMTQATCQREATLLYIFLMSFDLLPPDLPLLAIDQRFPEQLLPVESQLIQRFADGLWQIFTQMFVGTPLTASEKQLIRYCLTQMGYFLYFFQGGYLNPDTEEYLSLRNVIVLEKLQIGARQALATVYQQCQLPFDLKDSHTHLMYNRFLDLFINIYQRHPSPLLLGFNYQGWPLARDTLFRYLTDIMKAQHVVVEYYRPQQRYDMVVTNLADPAIAKNSYATFVIPDGITDKELQRIMAFISYRREHFNDFQQILSY